VTKYPADDNANPDDIVCADIEWRNGTPFSLDFEDFYYHSGEPFVENGLLETQYLFLQQNKLPQRWQDLSTSDSASKSFVIGETGFGSGLNFLCACDLWLKTAPKDWRLLFISTELRPIKKSDLKAIFQSWNILTALSGELLEQYPELLSGTHIISMADGRIQLYLMLGEANNMLQKIAQSPEPGFASYGKQPIDAWFLDGFAPAKNPQLWCQQIFQTLASLSSEKTTFATFTSASEVRKGLINAGFSVKKIAGFGRKRESLKGLYRGPKKPLNNAYTHWYLNHSPPITNCREAVVLGAGIAGCTTAVALAKRGFDVTVIDRHERAGQEGSGNHQAIVYPKLSAQSDQLPRINLTAMLLASRYYQPLWRQGLGAQSGVLLLPSGNQSEQEFINIGQRFCEHKDLVRLVNNSEIGKLSGIRLQANTGLFFPSLGWLPPSLVCQRLLRDHCIPLVQADVTHFDHSARTNRWQLHTQSGQSTYSAPILVIATAHGCQQFAQTEFLNVSQLRGQVTHIPSNTKSRALNTVICGKGYIAPADQGFHSCGATYNKGVFSTELRTEDHQANLDTLFKTDGGITAVLGDLCPEMLQGRANYRCTSRDYLPMVGAVPNVSEFLQSFELLRANANKTIDQMGTYLPNLYVNCAMGSRGLSYAPLTAELIAAEIMGDIAPLERDLRLAMHPARFIIRDLKRRKI
jgi:tRNA 5-methylaminomethyl-2-thiouridine biosynthesis bifunctional protein